MSKSSFSLKPALYIADSSPGGSGLSAKLYEIINHLSFSAAEHTAKCACSNGCPGCIGPLGGSVQGMKSVIRSLLFDLVNGDGNSGITIN